VASVLIPLDIYEQLASTSMALSHSIIELSSLISEPGPINQAVGKVLERSIELDLLMLAITQANRKEYEPPEAT
jgi:hypothetical protein